MSTWFVSSYNRAGTAHVWEPHHWKPELAVSICGVKVEKLENLKLENLESEDRALRRCRMCVAKLAKTPEPTK